MPSCRRALRPACDDAERRRQFEAHCRPTTGPECAFGASGACHECSCLLEQHIVLGLTGTAAPSVVGPDHTPPRSACSRRSGARRQAGVRPVSRCCTTLAERYRPSADLARDGQRLARAGAGAAPRPNPGPAEAATPPSSRRSYSAPATTLNGAEDGGLVRRLARPPPMIAILLGSDDTTSGARQRTRIHTVSLRHRRFGMRGSVRISTRIRIPLPCRPAQKPGHSVYCPSLSRPDLPPGAATDTNRNPSSAIATAATGFPGSPVTARGRDEMWSPRVWCFGSRKQYKFRMLVYSTLLKVAVCPAGTATRLPCPAAGRGAAQGGPKPTPAGFF